MGFGGLRVGEWWGWDGVVVVRRSVSHGGRHPVALVPQFERAHGGGFTANGLLSLVSRFFFFFSRNIFIIFHFAMIAHITWRGGPICSRTGSLQSKGAGVGVGY